MTIVSSMAGDLWKRQTTFAAPNLAGIAWDGGEFFTVGAGGTILHSGGIDLSVEATNYPIDLVHVNDPYNYVFSVANVGNLNSRVAQFQHAVPLNLSVTDVIPSNGGNCDLTIYCSSIYVVNAGDPATSVAIRATAATEGAITLSALIASTGDTNSGNNNISFDATILPEIPPTPPNPWPSAYR